MSDKPKKHLLILAWEYPGVNSLSGAALSRRIGQVAEGFANEGWLVSVIHRNHIGEKNLPSNGIKISDSITRYPMDGEPITPNSKWSKLPIIRKIATFYYIIFRGDRSFRWALNIKTFLKENFINKPDLIIGFYSPKGPLLAASMASKQFGTPWFADLQDPLSDGGKKILGSLNYVWSRKILKQASLIVHVSPEWSKETSHILNKEVMTLRHAIPEEIKMKENSDFSFSILYSGSLNKEKQSPLPLLQAIETINKTSFPRTIKLRLACSESVYLKFKQVAEEAAIDSSSIEWLGWLSQEQLKESIINSDCLILIPWITEDRIVVPSKLYEYMAYNKPVLIAGPDSGAIAPLLKEWEHRDVICDSKEKIELALKELYANNTSSSFLIRNNCKNVLEKKDLVNSYIDKYTQLFN